MTDEKQPELEQHDDKLELEKEKLSDLDVPEEDAEDVKGGVHYDVTYRDGRALTLYVSLRNRGAFTVTVRSGRRIGMPAISPDFSRLLRFGRAVDITRLIEEIGYMPQFSAAEAVADYARHQGGRRLLPSLREVAVGR